MFFFFVFWGVGYLLAGKFISIDTESASQMEYFIQKPTLVRPLHCFLGTYQWYPSFPDQSLKVSLNFTVEKYGNQYLQDGIPISSYNFKSCLMALMFLYMSVVILMVVKRRIKRSLSADLSSCWTLVYHISLFCEINLYLLVK